MANLAPEATNLLTRTSPGKPIALVVAVENEHQDTGTGAEELLRQRRPCNTVRVSQEGRHSILKVHEKHDPQNICTLRAIHYFTRYTVPGTFIVYQMKHQGLFSATRRP